MPLEWRITSDRFDDAYLTADRGDHRFELEELVHIDGRWRARWCLIRPSGLNDRERHPITEGSLQECMAACEVDDPILVGPGEK